MGATGGEVAQFVAIRREDRRHHGDVRQMRAAGIGRVDQPGVARPQLRAEAMQDGAYRIAHAAEMYRDVRRVGDQVAGGIKQRTGKIQPFADIHRAGAVLQRVAHVFRDAHEAAVEQRQPGRVRTRRVWPAQAVACRAQQQVAAFSQGDPPAGFEHQRRAGFDDQRRPVQGLVNGELITLKHRGVEPGVVKKYRTQCNWRSRRGRQIEHGFRLAAATDGFRFQRDADQFARRVGKAETGAVFGVEGCSHVILRTQRYGQHAVGAGIAQQGAAGFPGACIALVGQRCKRPFHRRLPHCTLLRQTDAIGRQHRREG